ncbi:MAG TPA: PIN domain-containing protein [Tepidiformaceae bacterium]
MSSEVLDSTVVIDHLNGITAARDVIERSESPAISIITWIEVLAGVRNPAEERAGRELLANLTVVPLSEEIAEDAVRLRRTKHLKLPDAVILATARSLGVPLVTRNTKDFGASEPGIEIAYRI